MGLTPTAGCAVAAAFLVSSLVAAQTPPDAVPANGVLTAERAQQTFRLSYFNRQIGVLRARVAGREPDERGLGAIHVLDRLVEDRATEPIETRAVGGGTLITVASRGVLLLTAADVDELAGETLESDTATAVAQLRRALAEADEARAPVILLRASVLSLLAIALSIAALWALNRLRRRLTTRLISEAERRIAKTGLAPLDTLRAARVNEAQRYFTTALFTTFDLVVCYAVAGFVLRQFPYSRPWGESMRGFLVATVEMLSLKFVSALPGLLTVALILVATRLLVRLAAVWFRAVEIGKVRVSWLHPETAQPTRRIVAILLWVFAAIVAYPYMPGSQTEGFKGVSVFLGLMLTFGSSGLVNQIMSSFMITYSRALRVGDFVKIGDVEGTVTQLGVLSTKMLTVWDEEVTIPNAVVVSQTTVDYSRRPEVFTLTSVTIGYDAPWRQVHALLLAAAARTPGLRPAPKPLVLQMSLEDFYVKYTLLVSLELQRERPHVLDALHANIQDLFNEYGVQIMSPNYMVDPAGPKVVPKEQWFAAPATPSGASHPSAARSI